MAGDWIPIRINLRDDPNVVAIASALNIDEYATIGMLVQFWGWADQHTTDGNARSVTLSWIDARIGVTGFAAALVSQGWLVETESGIAIPNFDRFLGKNGKTRAKTNRRVAAHREVKRNCNDPSVTKSLPENRTEQKREEPIGSSKSPPSAATSRKHQFSPWDRQFAERMHADILAIVPSAKAPSFDSWANDIRLLREADGRSETEIESLWQFANGDDFWRSVLLSPAKLRAKWTQLAAKRSAASRGHPARSGGGKDLMAGHRDFATLLEKSNAAPAVQQSDVGVGSVARSRLLG